MVTSSSRIRELILVSALASVTLCQPALAARFIDTSGYWAEKYVNKLSDKNIIPSSQDGKFKPNDPITRAELAVWIVKVLGLEKQPVSSTPSFADVKPSDPYYKAVEIIRQNNYIAGYADGYRPKQFMQRGEMISIISRALNAPRLDGESVTQELSRFSDQSKIPQWARPGIAIASKEGILVMHTPDKVDATGIATRGETAAILCALNDYLTERNVSEKIQRADLGEPADSSQGGSSPGYPQYQGQVQKQEGSPATAYAPPPVGSPPGGYPQGTPPGTYVQPGYPPPGYPPPGGYPIYGGTGQTGGYQGGPPLQGQVSTVAAGTTLNGSLRNSLDSGSSQPGEPVEITLSQPLMGAEGSLILPPGTTLTGSVTNVVSARRFHFGANGKLDVKFTQCALPDGRRIPISASVDTDVIRLTGSTTAGRFGKGALTTAVGAGSGAALGTALGAIVGATSHGRVGRATGMGAVFGTAIGGGVGLVGAGVRKGSEIKIPAGTSMPIKIDQTFQVTGAVASASPYGMPPAYGAPQYATPPQYAAPPQYGAPPNGAPTNYPLPPFSTPGQPPAQQPQPIYYQ